MKDNDFRTDTDYVIKKKFFEKAGSLLMTAISLTGFASIGGIWSIISIVRDGSLSEIGINAFAWRSLMFLCMFCVFIALIKIAIDEKPFSKTLSICFWIIGSLVIVASIMFPRLSGYQSSGFELFSSKNFVLIDGMILVVGILFIILGSLLKEGFQMQKDMEEIL